MSSSPGKWPAFLVVATGVFMSTLDSSMVNIALPFIMKDFHSSLRATQWVVMSYLLTITSSLLFFGHLADRLGRARIYAGGLLIFALGSLACALSPSLPLLVGARFFQALGAAMMMATGPAIIKDTFPRAQLGRGLGLIGMAVSLGLMSGPALGGLLLEFSSWRVLFFITAPLGLIFALMAGRLLPDSAGAHAGGPVDWLGGLTWGTSLALLSLTLSNAAADNSRMSGLIITSLAGVAGMGCFLAIESRTRHPLLAMALLKNRPLALAIVSAMLSFVLLFSAILLTPFYLHRALGLAPAKIGLIMLAIPAALLVVSPMAGWLADHVGARIVSTIGLGVSTLGILLLSDLNPATQPGLIAGKLLLLGLGQALFLSPNSAAVLNQVTPDNTGAASALLATARNLGMLLGIALATLLFSLFFRELTGGLDLRDFQPAHTAQFMSAMRLALFGAALAGLFGMAASWLRGGQSAK